MNISLHECAFMFICFICLDRFTFIRILMCGIVLLISPSIFVLFFLHCGYPFCLPLLSLSSFMAVDHSVLSQSIQLMHVLPRHILKAVIYSRITLYHHLLFDNQFFSSLFFTVLISTIQLIHIIHHTFILILHHPILLIPHHPITGVLGPFPPRVLARGKETIKYFTLSNIVYEKSPVCYSAVQYTTVQYSTVL